MIILLAKRLGSATCGTKFDTMKLFNVHRKKCRINVKEDGIKNEKVNIEGIKDLITPTQT